VNLHTFLYETSNILLSRHTKPTGGTQYKISFTLYRCNIRNLEAMGIRPEDIHSAACQDIYIRGTDSLSVTGDRINGFVEP
jgi:hypothetical protein